MLGELKEIKDDYHILFENAPLGYHALDENGCILFVNKAWLRFFGYSKEEVRGKWFGDFLTTISKERFKVKFPEFKIIGEVSGNEYEVVNKIGEQAIITFYGKISRDENGKFIRANYMFQDITPQKQLKRDLIDITKRNKGEEKSNNLLNTILDTTHVLIAYMDIQFNFIRVNYAYAEADEKDMSFFPGKNHFKLYPNNDNEKIFRKVVETGEPYFAEAKQFEYAENPERGISYWDWSLKPIKDSRGILDGLLLTLQNVTERKKVEKELIDLQKRNRAWLENSPVCTKILDLDFNLQYMSASGIRDLQIDDITQHYGKPYPFYFYPESFKNQMTGNLKITRETGKVIEQEASVVDTEGNELWYNSTIVPVSDDNDQVEYIIVVSVETTKRKKAEKELRDSEEKLKKFMESAIDGFHLFDPELNYLEANEASLQMLGVKKKADLIGKNILDIAPNLKATGRYDKYLDVIKTGNPFSSEDVLFERGDGNKSYYLSVRAFKVGENLGMIFTDITERKLAEEERKKFFNLRLHLLLISGLDGVIKRVNPGWSEILGYSFEELEGKMFMDFVHLDDRASTMAEMEKLSKGMTTLYFENRYRHKNGSYHLLAWSAIADQNKEEVYAIAHDITEKKKVEEELKDSEEKLHSLINNISDVLIEFDINGKISFVSSQIINLLGYQPEEFKGLNLFKLVHPEDNVILKPLRGPNEILNFELRLKHKNGYFIPVSIRGSNVMTKGKLKVIGVLRDITERKKVESMMKREVKQLKELEQIRTDLINRISHEFNTPLSSIMSGSDLLLLHYKDEFSDDTVEIIDIINKGGYRLKDMVDNLIIAYRIDSDELKLILKKKNIISIIKDRIDDVMHQAQRRGVFLNVELLPEILVNIDESLISKAILNLLTNAIKNTPLKGNICVKTIDHHNYLDIQIEDTGVGFTKKEKLSLFKKFGKIERYGKGLDIDIEGPGLGLYISNEIVKLHKGEILVNSKGRNKGSKFIIRLYRN